MQNAVGNKSAAFISLILILALIHTSSITCHSCAMLQPLTNHDWISGNLRILNVELLAHEQIHH